jgi:hypothetical protein
MDIHNLVVEAGGTDVHNMFQDNHYIGFSFSLLSK